MTIHARPVDPDHAHRSLAGEPATLWHSNERFFREMLNLDRGSAPQSVIAHVVLNHARFGREILSVGGNREAARLVGLEVNRISITGYILAGGAAGLAGILLAARLGTAQASAGTGSELVVIAAVIIGGTSLFGGNATIIGTAIGCMLLSSLSNGMTVVGLSAFYQNVVVGVVIIVAVGVDQWRRSRLLHQ